MPNTTIEWAPFEIADDVSDTNLIQASDRLQTEFVTKQPGFIRRELLKGQNGKWVDLVFWATPEDAEHAAKSAEHSESCHHYFQLMKAVDPKDPSVGILHFSHVKTYQA